jgi:hypothetical protein
MTLPEAATSIRRTSPPWTQRAIAKSPRSNFNTNYAELGFADGRNGKPNRAWITLRALAEQRGIVRTPTKPGQSWSDVEKRMQEIRKLLREHFCVSTDPIPFIEGGGYQARFKIGCSPSFRT